MILSAKTPRPLRLDPKLFDDRPPFLGIGFPEGAQRFGGLALTRIDLISLTELKTAQIASNARAYTMLVSCSAKEDANTNQ